jgi:nitrate reductase alpha subunit
MAPEGKRSRRELTGKEILQALRKKVPAKEYTGVQRTRGVRHYNNHEEREEPKRVEVKKENKEKMSEEDKNKIKSKVSDLVGTKGAIIFNKNLEVVRKIPISRLGYTDETQEPFAIAIDGTATPKIVSICESMGCHNLIATNFVDIDTNIHLISL